MYSHYFVSIILGPKWDVQVINGVAVLLEKVVWVDEY